MLTGQVIRADDLAKLKQQLHRGLNTQELLKLNKTETGGL